MPRPGSAGPSRPIDLALLTEERYESLPPDAPAWSRQLLAEDELLAAALRRRGLTVERVAWSRAGFDWRRTRAALFRSTWDYFHREREFRAWLDAVEPQTRLLHSAPLVRWNLDKRYLLELERAGVPIVPSCVRRPGESLGLRELFDRFHAEELVVKPVVSGAARETRRVGRPQAEAVEREVAPLLAAEAFLIQPFQPEIVEAGEISLIAIGGEPSHAVRKRPRAGDFRVQDDHGGTVELHAPSPEELAFGRQTLAAAPFPTTYARIDFVPTNAGPRLMELELIEPELFFRFRPAAADELAAAVVAQVAR